jgi:hypothetical protein
MRTELGKCFLVLLLFATPFFAQIAVLHSATEDSLTVREAERVCLSEVLIPATESDSSAQSVEAKHEVGVSARQVCRGWEFAFGSVPTWLQRSRVPFGLGSVRQIEK